MKYIQTNILLQFDNFWKLFTLAALLRLPGLFMPYWYDEAFTALSTRLPFERWVAYLVGDVHPPLWYILVWPLAQLTDSEWGPRLPAYLFSLLALWLLWRIVAHTQWPGGYMAVVAMAVLPFWVFYASEARMYSMIAALVLLAYYAMLTGRPAWWFIALCGLLWSHNYGMFYVAVLWPCAVAQWHTERRRVVEYTTLTVLSGALFAANWLLPVTLAQMLTLSGGYWIQPLTAGQLMQNIFYLVVGFTVPPELLALALVLTFAALTWLVLTGVQHWRSLPYGWQGVLWMTVGVGLLAQLVSMAYRPIFLFRALVGCVPFALLLAAWALQVSPRPARWMVGAGVMLVAAIGLGRFWLEPPKAEAEWFLSGLDTVRSEWQPGDVVLHASSASTIAWQTYGVDIPQRLATPCDSWDNYGGLSRQTIDAIEIPEMTVEDAMQGRVWLAVGLGPLSNPCTKPAIMPILERAEPVAVQYVNEYSISGIWLYTPGNAVTEYDYSQEVVCER